MLAGNVKILAQVFYLKLSIGLKCAIVYKILLCVPGPNL